jgi:hypothetical protein
MFIEEGRKGYYRFLRSVRVNTAEVVLESRIP